jgi:hypothetical protein
MKVKLRLICYSFVGIAFLLASIPTPLLAYDEGVGLANDWGGVWWDDTLDFSDTIDAYSGWNDYFTSNNPQSIWWEEESVGGIDNQKADYTELSLIMSHSCDLGGGITGVGFGPNAGIAEPDSVRLGYESPDLYGHNRWWFVIECSVLKTSSYPSWEDALTGMHQMLNFSMDPTIVAGDLDQLAKRLTGTGGYNQETIKDAFCHTYIDDGLHNGNVVRILAECYDVINDKIDYSSSSITVDNTKQVWTIYG